MTDLTFTTTPLSDAAFVAFTIRKGDNLHAEIWLESGGQAAEPLERLVETFPAGASRPLVELQSALAPLRGLSWSDPRTEGSYVVIRAQKNDLRFAARTLTGFNYPPEPEEVDRAKSRLESTMEVIFPL